MGGIAREPILQFIGKKNIVGAEIGVRIGKHARFILDTIDIKKLYLIDPYKPFFECDRIKGQNECDSWLLEARNNLKKYNDKIVWLLDYSKNAYKYIGNEELDFVYIDGDHSYSVMCKDIELYYPKVKNGGIISGHDYGHVDVVKAVHERFGKNFNLDETTSWWVIKGKNAI